MNKSFSKMTTRFVESSQFIKDPVEYDDDYNTLLNVEYKSLVNQYNKLKQEELKKGKTYIEFSPEVKQIADDMNTIYWVIIQLALFKS